MVSIPIVSLDKIYVQPDENGIYFLDCTRINNSNKIIARNREPVDRQIERLASTIKEKKIFLADDVIFSGSVLRIIIDRFRRLGIEVEGIIASICTEKAYEYFNSNLRYGVLCNYLLGSKVLDQVCERDFYFGIAGSGIMVKTEDGLVKAPYFKPYGSPEERASIPIEARDFFSEGCLDRNIYLWEEIENIAGREILIGELPEKIVNTQEDWGVVKTLKKVRSRL